LAILVAGRSPLAEHQLEAVSKVILREDGFQSTARLPFRNLEGGQEESDLEMQILRFLPDCRQAVGRSE
jgi:hypothetical protein